MSSETVKVEKIEFNVVVGERGDILDLDFFEIAVPQEKNPYAPLFLIGLLFRCKGEKDEKCLSCTHDEIFLQLPPKHNPKEPAKIIPFDPKAFLESANFAKYSKDNESTHFGIFTCACGYGGCAGWSHGVEVKKRGNSVFWAFPDFGETLMLEFDLNYYIKYAEELPKELEKFYNSEGIALLKEFGTLKQVGIKQNQSDLRLIESLRVISFNNDNILRVELPIIVFITRLWAIIILPFRLLIEIGKYILGAFERPNDKK